MLDPAQSSAKSRRTLAGEVPQPPEADSTPIPEGVSGPLIDEPLYSIRVAESPGTRCAACGKQGTGTGPVGYLDDDPVCDLCLLERSTDGLVVLAVVRIYHRVASKFHGPRPYHAGRLETYC